MSAAKNAVEGILGLVDHVNATHFKINPVQASLIGEFNEDELRDAFDRLDRCRWRLAVLQNCVKHAVEHLLNSNQVEMFGSTVPESQPAVPRDHRSNGG